MTASAGNHRARRRLGGDQTPAIGDGRGPGAAHRRRRWRRSRAYPVELIEHGAGYDDAEAYALELGAHDGAAFVSPYNDPFVIAGQGTISAWSWTSRATAS